jgi:hypothetical protein
MSFGTPHDIASMHVSNRNGELLPGQEQKHVAGPGRPKEPGTWGSHDSPHGRDPIGIKSLDTVFNTDKSPLQHNYRGNSPLSIESKDMAALIGSLKSAFKTPTVLQESLNNNDNLSDSGTMLDENQLMEE